MIHKGQFIIHGGGWACKNEWVGSRSIRKTRIRRAYQQWLANVIPRSLVSVFKTSLPGYLKLVNSLSHRNISKWNRYWNVSTFCSTDRNGKWTFRTSEQCPHRFSNQLSLPVKRDLQREDKLNRKTALFRLPSVAKKRCYFSSLISIHDVWNQNELSFA